MTDPMYPISFYNPNGRTIEPYEVFSFDYIPTATNDDYRRRARIIAMNSVAIGNASGCEAYPDKDIVGDSQRAFMNIAVNSGIPVATLSYGKCGTGHDGALWVKIKDDESFPDELRPTDADYRGWELGPWNGDRHISGAGRGFLVCGPPDFDLGRILATQSRPETPFQAVALCREGCSQNDPDITSYPIPAMPLRRAGKHGMRICTRFPNAGRSQQLSNALRISISPSPNGILDWGPQNASCNSSDIDTESNRATVQWNGTYFETISGGRTVAEGYMELVSGEFYLSDPNTDCGCSTKLPVDVPCDIVLPDGTYGYALWDSVSKRLKLYDFCCPTGA